MDKSLLPFQNYTTLTEFQYSRLSKIFSKVYISCKDKNKFSFDANFIEDGIQNSNYAPTSGFLAIFKALQVACVFVISVDTPFVSEAVITQLIEKDKPVNDATIAKTNSGIQPLCGIYHRSLENAFQKMQQENRHTLNYLLKNSHTDFILFNDDATFLNLNNPQEYQNALKRVR